MVITHSIIFTYVFTNLDINKISEIGINHLIPMQIAKLKYLNLSSMHISKGFQNIGSMGIKWMNKI